MKVYELMTTLGSASADSDVTVGGLPIGHENVLLDQGDRKVDIRLDIQQVAVTPRDPERERLIRELKLIASGAFQGDCLFDPNDTVVVSADYARACTNDFGMAVVACFGINISDAQTYEQIADAILAKRAAEGGAA